MPTEFKLPELAEGVESAEVVRVLISQGDIVEQGQSVLELETDKATAELPSAYDGKVKEVKVSEGDEVHVGDVVFIIEESGETGDGEGEKAPEPEKPEEPSQQKEEAEEAAEEETEPEQDTPPKEKPEKKTEAKTEKPAEKPGEEPEEDIEPQEPAQTVPAAPSVRKFARELGVDLASVRGSGPHGRVSADDVKRHVRETNQQVGPSFAAGPSLPDFKQWGAVRREPMSRIRRRTAENVGQAWPHIPLVTQHDRADVSALDEFMRPLADEVEAAGGKLTLTSIVVKVVGYALQRFEQFNASVDFAKREIIFKGYVNIGVAVDTDSGLLVPVIKDVPAKNIVEIAVELKQMARKARDKKVRTEDLQGGTFTITNLGSIGGTYFTPLVYHPEVAILGVGRAYEEASPPGDEADSRLTLPLSLSYDHRAIDGADGIRFMRWIVEALENPVRMMLYA